jgi:hypothetical protein
MSRISDLTDRYLPVGDRTGNELYLRYNDALRFIDDCEKLGLIILGMDFYVIDHENRAFEVAVRDYTIQGNNLLDTPFPSKATIDRARLDLKDGLPNGAEWVSFVLQDPESSPTQKL